MTWMTRLMDGFPPSPEHQVTLANWRTSPCNRWASNPTHDPTYTAFLLIYNALLLVRPGGALATIGVALRRPPGRTNPARTTITRMPAAGIPTVST